MSCGDQRRLEPAGTPAGVQANVKIPSVRTGVARVSPRLSGKSDAARKIARPLHLRV